MPKAYSALAIGGHTFKVRALDPAGNVDATPATATWTIDTAAPDTAIASAPSGPTASTSATFAFTGTDNQSVVAYECQLDAGAWAACASPKAYASLAAGAHTFKVRAKDAAGNYDATPASASWLVDVTAPDTTLTASPPSPTALTTATLTFSGADDVAVASYQCQLDGGAWAACASPKALTGLATGAHTFKVRAKDTAGTVDASPATATWTVDTTAPDTTISSGPSGSTTATTASVTFSGTDNVAVAFYECQLDSASWAACTSPKAYSGITPGAHTIRVRAKDTAGTVDPTPATATWTVTAPVILGNQTVETYVDQNGAHEAEAFPYVASASGSAASVSVYLDSTSTGAVSVGLYTASGGRPGRLLASARIASPAAGAWNAAPLNGRPALVSGTTYYLALQSPTGGIRFRDRYSGPCNARAVGAHMDAMPKQWPDDEIGVWTTCPASVYLSSGSADTTAPDTSITVQPPTSTTATAASFTFGGTDDYSVSAYECQLDAGAWAACLSPRGHAGLSVGARSRCAAKTRRATWTRRRRR